MTFAQSGGYPGFVVTLPGDVDGDFHGAFEGGDQNGRLAGLIDIAQEKNHQFIRHPIAAGNPQNIPAGTTASSAAAGERARPEQRPVLSGSGVRRQCDAHGSATRAANVTRYNFNTANPLAGDPVVENATGLLMRNMPSG